MDYEYLYISFWNLGVLQIDRHIDNPSLPTNKIEIDDIPIPCSPPAAEMEVLATLDVHKDDATGQANRHYNQLGPERPRY